MNEVEDVADPVESVVASTSFILMISSDANNNCQLFMKNLLGRLTILPGILSLCRIRRPLSEAANDLQPLNIGTQKKEMNLLRNHFREPKNHAAGAA
jgi:hypothetical protein